MLLIVWSIFRGFQAWPPGESPHCPCPSISRQPLHPQQKWQEANQPQLPSQHDQLLRGLQVPAKIPCARPGHQGEAVVQEVVAELLCQQSEVQVLSNTRPDTGVWSEQMSHEVWMLSQYCLIYKCVYKISLIHLKIALKTIHTFQFHSIQREDCSRILCVYEVLVAKSKYLKWNPIHWRKCFIGFITESWLGSRLPLDPMGLMYGFQKNPKLPT